MTDQDKAVAPADYRVIIEASEKARSFGLMVGTSNWASFVYKQVIEALAQKSGAMPPVFGHFDGSPVCEEEEVREAIAAMQAWLTGAQRDRDNWKAHYHDKVEELAAMQSKLDQLEEMNAQLREQNTSLDAACAKLEQAEKDAAQWQHWKPWIERRVGDLSKYDAMKESN